MNSQETLLHNKIEEARKFGLEKQFEKAIQYYLAAIDLIDDNDPDKLILDIELGWSYFNNQNYSDAIKQFDTVLKRKEYLKPRQHFDCLRLIGFSHSIIGNRNEGISAIKKALAINLTERTKRYAYFELGKLLLDKGELDNAKYHLQKAASLFGKKETDYIFTLTYYLGFIAYLQKDISLANKMFTTIIQKSKDPKTRVNGFFGLAHIHFFSKDYPTLVDICEKILHLDQTFFDMETLGFFLCTAYLKLKMWPQLKLFFTELESNYPQGRYSKEYSKFRDTLEKNLS